MKTVIAGAVALAGLVAAVYVFNHSAAEVCREWSSGGWPCVQTTTSHPPWALPVAILIAGVAGLVAFAVSRVER